MASQGFTVIGIPQAVAKFTALGTQMAAINLRAVTAGALLVQNRAKITVHKITSNLARSIHIEPRTATPVYASVAVGTDVEYALAEENLHPYLRPALDDSAASVATAIGLALKAQLR